MKVLLIICLCVMLACLIAIVVSTLYAEYWRNKVRKFKKESEDN